MSKHEPLKQSNNNQMGCLSKFRRVTFALLALAGQFNNSNVISSEEIRLNCSDLMRLWLHKSASASALLIIGALWSLFFPYRPGVHGFTVSGILCEACTDN